MVRADDIVRASQHCEMFMTLWPSTHFKVHPLALHLQDHLNDLQDVGEGALPVVHFFLKGLHIARGFHCGQCHLVVFQQLEHLICCSGEGREEGEKRGERGEGKEEGEKRRGEEEEEDGEGHVRVAEEEERGKEMGTVEEKRKGVTRREKERR